ncbi:thiopurine S-methyltransferase family protein, partial [Vibrio parahaemolyticus V-223/04]
ALLTRLTRCLSPAAVQLMRCRIL